MEKQTKAARIKQALEGRTEVSSCQLWMEIGAELDMSYDSMNTTLARLVKEGRLTVTKQPSLGRDRNLYTPTELMNVKRIDLNIAAAEADRIVALTALFAQYQHIGITKLASLSGLSQRLVRQTVKVMLERGIVFDVGRCHNGPVYSSSRQGEVTTKQKIVFAVPPEVKARFKADRAVSVKVWNGVKYLREECVA